MYKRPEIIAIANQKGGVGKTSTATNLASALAKFKKKTLIIDLDPQANTTGSFDISPINRVPGIYQALSSRKNILQCIKRTNVPNLDIVPSDVNLSAAELDLVDVPRREFVLLGLLRNITNYEYIILDCPPSLGMLVVNAFVAASSLIIPMQCEFYSLEGLSNLLKTIDLVQKNLNSSLKILGVLLTMYDKRNKLTEQVEADVRNCLGNLVFRTIIPRNVRVSEAPSHGMPVVMYDERSTGAIHYVELAREILDNRSIVCQKIEA